MELEPLDRACTVGMYTYGTQSVQYVPGTPFIYSTYIRVYTYGVLHTSPYSLLLQYCGVGPEYVPYFTGNRYHEQPATVSRLGFSQASFASLRRHQRIYQVDPVADGLIFARNVEYVIRNEKTVSFVYV